MVQFFPLVSAHSTFAYVWMTYSANDACTALAFAYHVACTCPDATTSQLTGRPRAGMSFHDTRPQECSGIGFFIFAEQRMPDKLVSVFEQIGSKLPTCAR